MDLQKDFELKLKQIEMLNDFIVLYGKKPDIVPELYSIKTECNEIKQLLESCSEHLTQFQLNNRDRFTKLMETIQKQQTLMLKILEMDADHVSYAELNDNKKSTNDDIRNEKRCPSSILKEINNTATPNKYGMTKNGDQTVMSITDYTKSPFATKRSHHFRPMQLQFIDFERIITHDEFDKVPSYMKGRESLDSLQAFLEAVIIQCFTAKYALLPKRREAVAPMEMELWNLFRAQEEYFKGLKFITQGDICRVIDKQIDKKSSTRITILRHLKIIREERKNSAVCYIWCKN